MIGYIIAGLIGIVIYQLVCMIVYVATNEDDNVMAIMGMFIPFCVWNYCIGPVVAKIYFAWCRRHLNVYRCYYRTSKGELDCHFHPLYATDKVVAKLIQDETQPYFVKKVAEGKELKSIPYKHDIYKGQPKFKGWDMDKFMRLKDEEI
jgi:hypothetical protein